MNLFLKNILVRFRLFFEIEKPLFFLIGLTVISVVAFQIGRNPLRQFHHSSEFGDGKSKKTVRLLIERPYYIERWRERFLRESAVVDREGLVRGIFLGEDHYISPKVRPKPHRLP